MSRVVFPLLLLVTAVKADFCLVDYNVIDMSCGLFWFLVIGLPILLVVGCITCCCCCCCRSEPHHTHVSVNAHAPIQGKRKGDNPVLYQSVGSSRLCRGCKSPLLDAAKFCSLCGVASIENCSSCHAPLSSLSDGAKFCAQCGHDIV